MSENLQKSSGKSFREYKSREVSSVCLSSMEVGSGSGYGMFGSLCYGLHLIDPEED